MRKNRKIAGSISSICVRIYTELQMLCGSWIKWNEERDSIEFHINFAPYCNFYNARKIQWHQTLKSTFSKTRIERLKIEKYQNIKMQPWIHTFVMLASYAMILIRSFSMVVFIIFGPSPFSFALAILLSPLKPFSALWIVDIVAAAASRFSTRLLCNWFLPIAINCPLTVFISDKMYACCCNCSYNFVSSMNFGYFGGQNIFYVHCNNGD